MATIKLLPLGATKEGSGHKGSGLALWVDIMCGVLSMRGFHGHTTDPGEVNHFFGSWKIEAFGPLDEYRELMDARLRSIRETPPSEGFTRVMHAGMPEHEAELDRRANGVPLHPSVIDKLRALADETGVPLERGPLTAPRRLPPLDFGRFEVLTFDCYGTLIDWETGILAGLPGALAPHGVDGRRRRPPRAVRRA